MPGAANIDVSQLREFRKALRRAKPDSPEWAKEFAQLNKRSGDTIATEAGSRLRGRRGAKSARGITGVASQRGVRVRVANSKRAPHTLADVFGAKQRTGWYAAARYRSSTGRQHPPWVGQSWKPGDPGEGPGRGPYGLGPAIHANVDRVVEDWANAVEDLMTRFKSR